MGIILTVLRLEVSVYKVYITNQFQTIFAQGGGGGSVCNSKKNRKKNIFPTSSVIVLQ
jgi:hypothetical protein